LLSFKRWRNPDIVLLLFGEIGEDFSEIPVDLGSLFTE
jgi:hypothetical protein